jgi:hypothetical protein
MTGVMLWLAVIIAVVLVWAFFRQGGYKREALAAPPGPDWIKTEERFVDPTSGETLDVWFDPKSGERAYVRASRSGV